MFQGIEESKNELKDTSLYDEKYAKFTKKQDVIKEKIQEKFKKWRKALKDAEMMLMESVHTHCVPIEEQFMQSKRRLDKACEDTDQWLGKAKVILDDYMEK